MVKEKTNPENTNQDPSVAKEIIIEDGISKNEDSGSSKKKTKKSKSVKNKQDAKLLELKTELNNCEDRYLRLYSDFDNYRKRTAKERIELGKTASAEIIASLLTILDDFERAQKAMSEADNIEAVKEGVDLIYNKLSDILKKKGLEEIHCLGEDFNTDFHEAITNIPAESEDMKGKILDQTEKGYLLNGTILRYAKVIIGS